MNNVYQKKLSNLQRNNIKTYLNDCVIVRKDEKSKFEEIGKFCVEENLKYEIIYKPQKNLRFQDCFNIYRMKYLISLKANKKNKRKNESNIEDYEILYSLEFEDMEKHKRKKFENLDLEKMKEIIT